MVRKRRSTEMEKKNNTYAANISPMLITAVISVLFVLLSGSQIYAEEVLMPDLASGREQTVDVPRPFELSDGSYGPETEREADESIPVERKKMGLNSEEDMTWELVDGVLTISGSGGMGFHNTLGSLPWSGEQDNIEEVVINEGITAISHWAFTECENLRKVYIPASVTYIGYVAFFGCTSLTDVEFAEGSRLTRIDDGVFCNCESLEELVLPDTVEEIGGNMLQKTAIEQFTLPSGFAGDNVPFILSHSNVKRVTVPEENALYRSIDGVVYSKDLKTIVFYPHDQQQTKFVVPDEVTEIGGSAFHCSRNLKDIQFNNVETIGEYAFAYSDLETVTIPDSVTRVGEDAFSECESLRSISFGKGLNTIEFQVCYKCESLKEVELGAPESIGDQAFAQTEIEELILPESCKEVGIASFANSDLKRVETKGLKKIGLSAFSCCYELTDLKLNEGIEKIYGEAFSYCHQLNTVVIPSSCMFVHETAFMLFMDRIPLIILNKEMLRYGDDGYVDTLTVTGDRKYKEAEKMLSLLNAKRREQGAGELKMDELLLDDAMLRAAETTVINSHLRPCGENMMGERDLWGYERNSLNIAEYENIYRGPSDADSAMKAMLGSVTLKANMLNEKWKTAGIGCFRYKGKTYWVQCFSTDEHNTDFTVPEDDSAKMPIYIEDNEIYELTDPAEDKYKKIDLAFNIEGPEYMKPGEKDQINLTLNGVTFDAESVDWESSYDHIASVDKDGTIESLVEGVTAINALSLGNMRCSKEMQVCSPRSIKQPMTVKSVKNKTLKAAKLKKAGKTIKAVTVKNAQGAVSYKASGSKKALRALKINKKTGKVTIRKGTKKGIYKINITVTAAGAGFYKAGSCKAALTVKIK